MIESKQTCMLPIVQCGDTSMHFEYSNSSTYVEAFEYSNSSTYIIEDFEYSNSSAYII